MRKTSKTPAAKPRRRSRSRRSNPFAQLGALGLSTPLQFKNPLALAVIAAVSVVGILVVSFSLAATSYSVWSSSSRPATAAISDSQPAEVGLRFSTTQEGQISAIKFYKGSTNTGTHIGSLWSSQGALLASAEFTNETASGWQTVNFAAPVAIKPNTQYFASYYAPNGHYARDINYFKTSHNSGPFKVPANSSTKPNGVYLAGQHGFPSGGYQASNFWVDVVFTPGAAATPTPTVTPTPVATVTPDPTVTPTPTPGGGVTLAAVSDMQYSSGSANRAAVAQRVAAMNPDYVIMAGDLAYNGTSYQYSLFDRDYAGIKSKIRAELGNHDNYNKDGGTAYDNFLGSILHGTKPDFWYSFDAGAWHIVALNTGNDTATASYAVGSPQLAWLQADLDANASKPTLLFFHLPRYTAADYATYTTMQNSVKPIWDIALAHKVELIVNGHDHSYQRFAPMNRDGVATPDGIREFIAGTGGYSLRTVKPTAAPNLEKYSTTTDATWFGALKLVLYPDRYDWEFQNSAGAVLDSGSTPVHTR